MKYISVSHNNQVKLFYPTNSWIHFQIYQIRKIQWNMACFVMNDHSRYSTLTTEDRWTYLKILLFLQNWKSLVNTTINSQEVTHVAILFLTLDFCTLLPINLNEWVYCNRIFGDIINKVWLLQPNIRWHYQPAKSGYYNWIFGDLSNQIWLL